MPRLLIFCGCLFPAIAFAASEPDAPEWPREIRAPEATIVIYQPQLESFKDDKLTARAAVSVTPQGKTEPVFGAVWFAAHVETDRDTRMVTLIDLEVPEAKFPNATQEQLDKLAAILKREIPKGNMTISLDRILAALDLAEKEQAAAANIDTEPPRIMLVKDPAVLVTIDGKPELRPVENTKLMRVVNTPFLIILDPGTKAYYLKGGAEWLSASDIMGPWKSARPPAEVTALATDNVGAAAEGEESAPKPGREPQVIVATQPTELIVCDGEPTYTPISGTGLLYISNTESDVFMEIASQQYYVLLAGRWFTAPSLEGPWSYAASDKLPADFRKIPPGSEKGDVLASVAGTEEANDAVNETYIPQTAAIDRSKATLAVEYDGQPKFEPIEGTSMQYAVNTSYDVVKVQNQYYCCNEAVWYVAPQPAGPWVVCVSVPKVIYTIPPVCPLYPVTYVRVYYSTPAVVYVGYTPGYVGCYAYRGTVVYGTGYRYGGWYGTVYYPRPVTFGFGVHYNSVTGNWGFRVGVAGPNGWIVGGYRNGKYVTGGWVAGGRYGGRYGAWWGHGHTYPTATPYRGSVNRNINVGNVNIGNQVNIGNRNNIYNRPTNIDRNVARNQIVNRPQAGQLPARSPNNVFADREGNVFRRTEQGWQERSGNKWNPAERTPSPTQLPAARPGESARQPNREMRPSQTPSAPRQPSSLERENRARQRGEQRTSNFRQYQSSGGRGGAPMRSMPRGGRGRR